MCEGDLLVAHLGIVGLDERISRRGIGQIALPSFERRLDEARGRLRILVDEAAGRDHGRAVGRIAVPREQEELDGHPLLLGLERFRRGIGLLHHVLVGEEGLQVERVGPGLLVGIFEFPLQPWPPGRAARRRHQDRLVLEIAEARDVVVGHDALQIELERGPDGDDRQPLFEHLEDLEIVAHHEVGLAGEQQLRAVDLGTAHLERDVEPGLLVKPGRLGLVKPAMLGLREPTREERDLVGAECRRRPHGCAQDSSHDGHRWAHARETRACLRHWEPHCPCGPAADQSKSDAKKGRSAVRRAHGTDGRCRAPSGRAGNKSRPNSVRISPRPRQRHATGSL